MLRNKRPWLFALALCLAIASGYVYYRTSRVSAQTGEAPEELQTATVRVGSLVVSATGAGTVIPATQIDLSFQQSGTVAEVLVKVGETIKAGQALARLDDTAAHQAVATAEQALIIQEAALAELTAEPSADEVAAAEASFRSAEAALLSLQAGPSESEVAAAESSLRSAQAALTQAQTGTDPNEVAAAQGSLHAAEAGLQALQAGPDANELAQATATLQKTAVAVQEAQAAYDQVAWRNDIAASSQAAALQDATIDYDAARAAYDAVAAGPTIAEFASAQAAVDQARANLAALQNNADQAVSIASAEAQVVQAQSTLDELYAEATVEEVAAAEAQVAQARLALDELKNGPSAASLKSAEAQVEQTRIALEQAQHELAQTELTAPQDGTVMAINAEAGETASDPFITLADLAQPLIEAYLDESDLDKVATGYEAEVTFEAYPDETFTGHVVEVDPQLTVINNVTTVRALVQLDADSFARPQTLPVGMNATVDLIGGRAENALLVPVEALREIAPGQYAVFVVQGDQLTLHQVKVGLMDLIYAEITEGLSAGEVVSTGIVATQ
ncbi:MAG: efflux RND transporter periplasmic adaptor subunit [Ardenticatenaceae bacterium]|nr:efflux RND transporter periplasmic adaptor subunit [Ardenticatenaceae bacterium]HBY99069.1 hypothetical protein [Chloroflexota bacterium]